MWNATNNHTESPHTYTLFAAEIIAIFAYCLSAHSSTCWAILHIFNLQIDFYLTTKTNRPARNDNCTSVKHFYLNTSSWWLKAECDAMRCDSIFWKWLLDHGYLQIERKCSHFPSSMPSTNIYFTKFKLITNTSSVRIRQRRNGFTMLNCLFGFEMNLNGKYRYWLFTDFDILTRFKFRRKTSSAMVFPAKYMLKYLNVNGW